MDHAPTWDSITAAAGVPDPVLAVRLAPYLDAPATTLIDAATAGCFLPGAVELRARLETIVPNENGAPSSSRG